jgi:hypothetical protein
MPESTPADLEALTAALDMLSWSPADLRAFLPPSGYTEEGVVSECVEGFREAMAGLPGLLRREALAPAVAADVVECFLLISALMDDSVTRTAEAFAHHAQWQRVRALAGAALAVLQPT